MIPEVALIQQPTVNFDLLLTLCDRALGYSPARASDGLKREQPPAERFLACLAAIEDENAGADLPPHLLAHVSFSVLLVAVERDLLAILQAAGGMSVVCRETILGGVQLAVLTGTLAHWRDAVKSGTAKTGNVRACYCRVMSLFESAGLGDAWREFSKKPTPDRLFLLEDKRR